VKQRHLKNGQNPSMVISSSTLQESSEQLVKNNYSR